MFEYSPEKFIEHYIYGKQERISRNMAEGSKVADALMAEEATGDPLLDMMIVRFPKFERMDLAVEDPNGPEVEYVRKKKTIKAHIPALKDKNGDIPLLALPDTATNSFDKFKEYKTGVRKWTQNLADGSDQITFYATAIWLATGKIPEDIELVNGVFEYQEGGTLQPTGEILRFPTKRDLPRVLKMTKRIRNNWAGIKEVYKKELF